MSKSEFFEQVLNTSTPMQKKLRSSNRRRFRDERAGDSSAKEGVKTVVQEPPKQEVIKEPVLNVDNKAMSKGSITKQNFSSNLSQKESDIYEKLLGIRDSKTKVTKPFRLELLAQSLGLTRDQCKNSLFNMQKKGIIKHIPFSSADKVSGTGRYAKTQYEVLEIESEDGMF